MLEQRFEKCGSLLGERILEQWPPGRMLLAGNSLCSCEIRFLGRKVDEPSFAEATYTVRATEDFSLDPEATQCEMSVVVRFARLSRENDFRFREEMLRKQDAQLKAQGLGDLASLFKTITKRNVVQPLDLEFEIKRWVVQKASLYFPGIANVCASRYYLSVSRQKLQEMELFRSDEWEGPAVLRSNEADAQFDRLYGELAKKK